MYYNDKMISRRLLGVIRLLCIGKSWLVTNLLQFWNQLSILVHLQHNICSPHQLTVHIHLGKSRPVPAYKCQIYHTQQHRLQLQSLTRISSFLPWSWHHPVHCNGHIASHLLYVINLAPGDERWVVSGLTMHVENLHHQTAKPTLQIKSNKVNYIANCVGLCTIGADGSPFMNTTSGLFFTS